MPPVRWSLSPIYREKPVPFLRKVAVQRLYHLVVIDRYGSELCIKFGQPGAILDRRFVHFHHPERLAEQPGGDETGLARDARLLPLREEAGVLPGVQVKDMAMLRRVCEGGATALVRFSCFHASLD